MLKDFELAAKRHALIKEAFAALAARAGLSAARWVGSTVVKKPLTALGAAFTGMDMYSGTKSLSQAVRKTPVDVPGTFTAGSSTF